MTCEYIFPSILNVCHILALSEKDDFLPNSSEYTCKIFGEKFYANDNR